MLADEAGRDTDSVGLELGMWRVNGFSGATDYDCAGLLAKTPARGDGCWGEFVSGADASIRWIVERCEDSALERQDGDEASADGRIRVEGHEGLRRGRGLRRLVLS